MITIDFKYIKIVMYREETEEEIEVYLDDELEIIDHSSSIPLSTKEHKLIKLVIKDYFNE